MLLRWHLEDLMAGYDSTFTLSQVLNCTNLRFQMYNRETDDATLPDLSPQGIATSKALPTGAWQCFEYHLGTDGTVETWLNNVTVAGLTVKAGVSNPNAAQWQRSTVKPKVTAINFGWESYGGDTNTFWYDDIVVSSTRVGC
jgi:hypothetical protein